MKRIRLSRRFGPFPENVLALALLLVLPAVLYGQTTTAPISPLVAPATPAESLQTRIERARALIAAHRLDTASSELESIRAAASDDSMRSITSIMLMSVYLEEGNYGRAEALLEENFQARSPEKEESLGTYFALAGQAINGARIHLARYRSFGINTAEANLPAEAASDLNRMRSLLERMIAQAREVATQRRSYDSLSLLEDVLGIRLSLAKDSEDRSRWALDYASARESLASSQTQIASLSGTPPSRPAQGPIGIATAPSPYSTKKAAEVASETKTPLQNATPPEQQAAATTTAGPPPSQPAAQAVSTFVPAPDQAKQTTEAQVSDAGSLNAKATRRVLPRYPSIAKQSGVAGLVRVHVIVDETGKVVEVSRSEGPLVLRLAAEEAARQWLFGPSSSDGQPARMSGYIDFTFML